MDGSINFLRIDREATHPQITQKMQSLFERTGLKPAPVDEQNPTLCLLDDWCMSGTTFAKFSLAAQELGLDRSELSFITLCGRRIPGISHFVGDPEIDFRNSTWTDVKDIIGIIFPRSDRMMARPAFGPKAAAARASIQAAMKEHYGSSA